MTDKKAPKGLLLLGLLIAASLAVAAACGGSAAGDTLTVAAAANIQPVVAEVGRLFQEETGISVIFSFGSSGRLASQVEQGAPFDVFVSADVDYVDRLRQGGHIIADTQVSYAVGRLALIATRDDISTLDDLLKPQVRRIAIANPNHAPYGQAAAQALRSAGLWQKLEDKIVFGENVRQAFQFVRSGQAEAGLVALSLAVADGVNYVVMDDSLHQPLVQAAAVVAAIDDEGPARQFLAFLRGPQAQKVLACYGFALPQN
ncbi:MAG: molybdate ABC transporter substrate-binding protein [Dehalococcoidia bacterium]